MAFLYCYILKIVGDDWREKVMTVGWQ